MSDSGFGSDATLVALTTLSEAQRQRALERFALLRPHLEDEVPLSRLARHHALSLRTLQRWLHQYRQQGLAGLARKARSDASQPRSVSFALEQLIEGLALQKPPPSVRTIHRQVSVFAQQRGEAAPSYSTVYALVRRIDPALLTLAHEGAKVYRETYDLLHRREAEGPNAIWQADHSLLDVWVVNEQGQPVRPWLTLIEDDYSRAVCGYLLFFEPPCIQQTALALRQAIWRKAEAEWHVCGIPGVLYVDHGSDFTSRHLEQVGADLRMRLVFSQPGVPRGRGKVERLFQTISQRFLCHQPGYMPEGAAMPSGALLTLAELDKRLRGVLLADYLVQPHSATGMAPQLRWEVGGFLPQMPDSLEQLDLLLLTVARPRRVHQDGIRFEGQRYIDPTLAAYVGEDVTIRYDPRDLAEIRVFHHDRFLCRAVCQELAGQSVSLKEIVRARNLRRRQLQSTLSDRAALVETFLQAHQTPETAKPTSEQEGTPAAPSTPKLKRYLND